MKTSPAPKLLMTTEMCRITGYSPKTLYLLAARGIANPQVTSGGVRIWSQSDIDAIKAHREAMRPRRLAMLNSDRAVTSGR